MRDIKFRGKRVDNEEWVYGYYFKTPLTVENFGCGFIDGPERHCISDSNGVVYEVTPETVGQYTGLHDKKKKKIWEHDILKTPKGIRIVIYDAPSFYLAKNISDKIDVDLFSTPTIDEERIGNLHDNPELLKGGI